MSQLKVEICKIEEVNPIEKADKLEVVKVKGWHCVVSKGQYEVGNIVIYCPPDSIIPDKLIDKYNLEFLKKNDNFMSYFTELLNPSLYFKNETGFISQDFNSLI